MKPPSICYIITIINYTKYINHIELYKNIYNMSGKAEEKTYQERPFSPSLPSAWTPRSSVEEKIEKGKKSFTIGAYIDGELKSTATGSSKREAERMVSKKIILEL